MVQQMEQLKKQLEEWKEQRGGWQKEQQAEWLARLKLWLLLPVASVDMLDNAATNICCEQYYVTNLSFLLRLFTVGSRLLDVEWRNFSDILFVITGLVIVDDDVLALLVLG